MNNQYVYFGNLFPNEPQYKSGKFVGLALSPKFDRDVLHDARHPMRFEDDSVHGFQSQDVFEHIEYEKLPTILDDIYRCLKPGGLFRMSVPDYQSPLLMARSVYDHEGNILLDLSMGGKLSAAHGGQVDVQLPSDGSAHLWHPTIQSVRALILQSDIRKCDRIEFLHYWETRSEAVVHAFDHTLMPVARVPPHDMRAGGKPISIVVDFIK